MKRRPGETAVLQQVWKGRVWAARYGRTDLGFETMDLMLDVIIDPDGTWQWKDEDELQTFVARGVFDHSLAERIGREALAVVGAAQRNEPPFGESWRNCRPDPSWRQPELPTGWDEPCRPTAPGTT